MIKINLNRSRIGAGVEEGNTGVLPPTENPGISARDTLVRLLAISLGTVGLMLYQKQNIDNLNSQLAAVNAQSTQLKAQIDEKTAELAKLKDIEPQAQALNDKLKILRQYSKLRLEELQSLDFVQSIIPERVWLNNIRYEKRNYIIKGNAVETVDLSQFVQKLEGSAYFQDVIVVQDVERAVVGGAKMREFEVDAHSGGQGEAQ